MKKVYSIALFGTGDKYAQYLPAFCIGALNLFPIDQGWRVRVHADDAVLDTQYGEFLLCMFGAGLVELRAKESEPLTKAMLWRMEPVFDEDVDYVFCRDIDAPPMPRDRAVCEQFIASGAAIGTCHDNVAHAGVMGGLCHFATEAFRNQTGIHSLDRLYAYAEQRAVKWSQHGTDQNVLNRLVRERPNLVLLEHRYNGWLCGAVGPERREAGVYDCVAYSTPTPNGPFSFHPGEQPTRPEADSLGNHLGCAGYDHQAAFRFWEEHGDEEIARVVRACLNKGCGA